MASSLSKFKVRFLRRSEKEGDEDPGLDNVDSIRSPDSVPNLEDYEGTMVGMNISESADQPLGLAGALANSPGSEGLASSMHEMQSTFMDEIGLGEGPSLEKPPPDEEEASGWRKSYGFNWSKLALALLALCGLLAITTLVLHFEGVQMGKRVDNAVLVVQSLEWKSTNLQQVLADNVLDSKCTRYEEMFLRWLNSFCKIVNCTSELCHKNWTPYQGNCYFFSKSKLGWEQSRQDCISHGSELLVIRNKKEQKFAATFDTQKVYWIGMKEVPQGSTWMWVDGTYLQDNLTFWDRNYPDSHFDYDMEAFKNCGLLRDGAWANAVCSTVLQWICKRRSERLPISLLGES